VLGDLLHLDGSLQELFGGLGLEELLNEDGLPPLLPPDELGLLVGGGKNDGGGGAAGSGDGCVIVLLVARGVDGCGDGGLREGGIGGEGCSRREEGVELLLEVL
jgi:hypothetical protein